MSTPTEPAAQESELRPCICGRNDKGAFAPIWCVGDAQKNLGWHIECFCGWQGPKKESLAEAIAAWNTRAPQPPTAQPVIGSLKLSAIPHDRLYAGQSRKWFVKVDKDFRSEAKALAFIESCRAAQQKETGE